jgi:hypothetical protein
MRQIKLMALIALIPGIFSIVQGFMTARAIQRDRVDIRGAVTRIKLIDGRSSRKNRLGAIRLILLNRLNCSSRNAGRILRRFVCPKE